MANILIIDDDEPSLELLLRLMRAAGHNAVGATTGQEALLDADFKAPDLVLCDVMMPDLDGFEVLRQFRYLARRKVPVVAVTALATAEDREHILAAGFDGYFSKPIVPQTFAHQVEQFLERNRLARLVAALRPEAR